MEDHLELEQSSGTHHLTAECTCCKSARRTACPPGQTTLGPSPSLKPRAGSSLTVAQQRQRPKGIQKTPKDLEARGAWAQSWRPTDSSCYWLSLHQASLQLAWLPRPYTGSLPLDAQHSPAPFVTLGVPIITTPDLPLPQHEELGVAPPQGPAQDPHPAG